MKPRKTARPLPSTRARNLFSLSRLAQRNRGSVCKYSGTGGGREVLDACERRVQTRWGPNRPPLSPSVRTPHPKLYTVQRNSGRAGGGSGSTRVPGRTPRKKGSDHEQGFLSVYSFVVSGTELKPFLGVSDPRFMMCTRAGCFAKLFLRIDTI